MSEISTSDIVLAATLRCHNFQMDRIEREIGRRGLFFFADVPEDFIKDYDLQKITVVPQDFNAAIKTLTQAVRRLN